MITKLSFLTKVLVFLMVFINFNKIFANNVLDNYPNTETANNNVSSHLIKKYKHYCETSPYDCLKLNMLMEIRKMGHQKYYPITDELWLEETNHANTSVNVNNANLNSDTKTYVKHTKSSLKHLQINKDNIKLNKIISELIDLFKTHSLFFTVVPGKDVEIYRKPRDGKFVMKLQGDDSTSYPYFTLVDSTPNPHRESRTFGLAGIARRRLMMAIIPIMFKMGVMMMMLVVLMFLTLKSVTIGGLLLFIAATSLISKFKHWMSPHHHAYHSAADVGEKNIHLHIHTDGHGSQWGSSSHIVPHSSGYSSFPSSSYGSPSSYGSSYPEGNSWSRQGVVGGLSSGGDALSITGTLNGQRIHIPLPSGRSPAVGFSSPATSYSVSSSEDYTFLGKAASR